MRKIHIVLMKYPELKIVGEWESTEREVLSWLVLFKHFLEYTDGSLASASATA